MVRWTTCCVMQAWKYGSRESRNVFLLTELVPSLPWVWPFEVNSVVLHVSVARTCFITCIIHPSIFNYLSVVGSRGMPEPPKLAPFQVKEQRTYSEPLADDRTSHPISKGDASHPSKTSGMAETIRWTQDTIKHDVVLPSTVYIFPTIYLQ